MNGAKPWTVCADGLHLTVRVTPKGSRDSVDGLDTLSSGQSVLKVRVRAAPADGKANDALGRLLAKTAGIPVTCVAIVQGETARLKKFHLRGNAQAIAARLDLAVLQTSKRT